jgi:hypothetical protein
MRHEQIDLIDLSPLGLWTAREPSPDPETTLRALWARQGVPQERQEAMIAEITAKAQPGAMVGPFRISETPPAPAKKCLKCGKPARAGSCFCTEKCKSTWQSSMSAYTARLSKTRAAEETPELF